MSELGDKFKCGECDGLGQTERMVEGYMEFGDCPACEGDGEARVEITIREYHDLQGYKFMYGQCQH